MGRPRGFDREAALHIAMHLFWEHGYEQTSVSQLAESMQISMPSLYSAFGDKKALFDEAVVLYQASPESVLTKALSAPTAHEVFHQLLKGAAREYTSHAHPHGCLVNADSTLGAERRRNRDLLTTRLRAAVDTGDLPPDADPVVLSSYLSATMTGMSTLARDGAGPVQLKRVADVALKSLTLRAT